MAMMAVQVLRPAQPTPTSSRRPGENPLAPKRAPVSRQTASPGACGPPSNVGGRPRPSAAEGAGTAAPMQRKLRVGAVDDPLERQADRVADQVVVDLGSPTAAGAGRGVLQRKCSCGGEAASGGECEACKQKRLQRVASGPAGAAAAPPLVHETLRSQGRPLDASARTSMESRFGHDFGKVRVHIDARAAESAGAVNALAYTVGHHIVFGAGQYDPHSATGARLIAHELTHVLQQDGGAERLQRQSDTSSGDGTSGIDASGGGGVDSDTSGGAATATSDDCSTPLSMTIVKSGAFKGGFTLDTYYPMLAGHWPHPGTAGPWVTAERAGVNVQLLGRIPPVCSPDLYAINQQRVTKLFTVDGVTQADQGQTHSDDFGEQQWDTSRPPFRQVWLAPESTGMVPTITFADTPDVAFVFQGQRAQSVERDVDYTTTLTGPSGSESVIWSTSVRYADGKVTTNTVT